MAFQCHNNSVSTQRWRLPALALLLCAALGTTLSSHAAPSWLDPQLQPSTLAPQSNLAPVNPPGISIERAAKIAKRTTGGRVLSTSRKLRGGEPGVEVRLLINGSRVTKVFVDSEGEVRGR
ncbi:MAG: PepSY domain-containing protein [Pseudomonadales bacterium]